MEKDKNQEVAVVDKNTPARRKKTQLPAKPVTMEQVFMEAIRTPDLDTASLEKLIELKERLDAKEAEKAFHAAMAKFQGAIDVIVGTKKAGSKTTGFRYAPREEIMRVIRKPLADAGLSATFKSELNDKIRKTTCTVTHVMGHSTSAAFESEKVAGTSLMNNIQEHGATLEYHERYALKMALNIVTEGEDDENQLKNENGKTVETITNAQTKLLEKQIGTADETLYKAILTTYNVTELHQIPANKLKDCKKRITDYKKAKREREKEKAQQDGKQTSMEIAT